MFDLAPPPLWVPPKPAIIRPWQAPPALAMLMVNQLTGFGVGAADGGIDSYVSLMLHCDGADASTTFTDSSANAFTATVEGNAQIDTGQSKFGGASYQGDGTGDGLAYGAQAAFAFGTGDFTIDWWGRINTTGVFQSFVDFIPAGGSGVYINIYVSNTQTVNIELNGATPITSAALSTGVWYHFALTRSGTSTRFFKDGTQVGSTYSDSNNYIVGTARPRIGNGGNAGTTSLNGWMDEIRISKGIARWTANFTPPTQAYSA